MSVVPVNYRLEFEPDLRKFRFSGREELLVRCGRPTRAITLHAAELEIKGAHILYGGQTVPARTRLDAKKETLTVTASRPVRGEATIVIEFDGTLNDRLLGFYRSRYTDGKKTKHLATTQFEAADARRAFPCMDEPAAKATFDIAITAEPGHTAISNMPVRSKTKKGKKTRFAFETTPVMSTYLVYLGVGEFEFLRGTDDGVTIRIITTRGKKSQGRYALGLAKRLLREYRKYFGIRYPLPKLDLIAVPDFAAGAMENWGAITFRETILLYDPAVSSTRTKQLIAEVVSHEIAHQWFGNLVTMKWWNDLWLNESFATYMATKFVDMIYPEWDLWGQFIEDAMNSAMSLDSLKSSHPIDVRVNKPSEIREIFDAISYDKGGCVLRMLERYVGEKNFRAGLKQYLKKYSYANAEGRDLWDAIGKASRLPVRAMIDTWIRQTGFPVVDAARSRSGISLKQRRFMLEPGSSQARWHIPVEVRAGSKTAKKLITARTGSIRADGSAPVINPGRYGFYRVRYDQSMLLDLKVMVDRKEMPPADRWAVQNDLFALCRAGQESVRSYLDFTDAYYDEPSYLVSVNVAHNLYRLYTKTAGEPYSALIREHARAYFANLHERLGWDAKKGEPHTDALLRSFVLTALGELGDDSIIKEAGRRFARYLKKPGTLRPDLRGAVYSLVALDGGIRTYGRFVSLYKKAGTQEEKLRYLGAMCSFRDRRLLLKTLEFSKTPHVRSQNAQLPVMRVSANIHGRTILWPWLQRNWKMLSGKVGHGNPIMSRIVSSISEVADSSMEPEIRRFFKKNPTPGTEMTLEQTLERMRADSRFLNRLSQELG